MSKSRVVKYQTKIIEKDCLECGVRFSQMRRLVSVCDLCKPIRAKKLRPQTFRDCLVCGKSFGPLRRLSQKTCSFSCRNRFIMVKERSLRVCTKEARRAQRRVSYAIDRGSIKRATECEFCKKEARTEGAHLDYSKPLDILWLCRPCHRKFDRDQPKNGTIVVREGRGRLYDQTKEENR